MRRQRMNLTWRRGPLTVIVMALAVTLPVAGCGPDEPEPTITPEAETEMPAAAPEPEPPPPEPEAEQGLAPEPEPQPLPGSGETAWAEDYEGLIEGLNEELYVPYDSATIEEVQRALQQRNLYSGPVNGVLDRPTMEALGEFQRNNDLEVTGIPTPLTREILLEQGQSP